MYICAINRFCCDLIGCTYNYFLCLLIYHHVTCHFLLNNILHALEGRYIVYLQVPRVFVNGKSVGGCDDTRAAHKSGQLRKMIEAQILLFHLFLSFYAFILFQSYSSLQIFHSNINGCLLLRSYFFVGQLIIALFAAND